MTLTNSPIMKIMVMAKGGYAVVLTVTSSISIKCKEHAFIDKTSYFSYFRFDEGVRVDPMQYINNFICTKV